jgi:crotonobetainyl-CoA:carnitine CoA-transferase CaiB-like acyl-CoA transferase
VELPLSGITVLEVCSSVAGPYATQILADLGARVIKIERPGTGDDTRQWGPPFQNGETMQFLAINRNKESVVLDLKSRLGQEPLWRLVEQADVFVQNYRPGVLERLGFTYEALSARNPHLIYCGISAFGSTGPLRDLAGYDPLMQAIAGIMRMNGEPDRPPIRVANSLIDQGTAMWCAIGVLAALFRRQTTGTGERVDAALFETALGWVPVQVQTYLANGNDPRPQGSGVSFLAPYRVFATADGYFMVAVANDNLWQKLCGALDRPDLAVDPQLATNPLRVEHRAELEATLSAIFATHTNAHWERCLQAAGVPCAPVQTVGEAVRDPQTAASGMLQHVPHPSIPELQVLGIPLQFDGARPAPRLAPPLLGADTERVLAELGLTED